MSVNRKRITKIETLLTPRQAVFHWLNEAQRDGPFLAYMERLAAARKCDRMCTGLLDQVQKAVLRPMKGQSTATVARARTQALYDTYFLRELVFKANEAVLGERQVHILNSILLSRQFEDYVSAHDELRSLLEHVQRLPYPLDVTTAATVEADVGA